MTDDGTARDAAPEATQREVDEAVRQADLADDEDE